MEKYLYLGVLLFAISYPLAQSFEHRIRYASQWKYLFPGMGLTAAFFIVWDIWFTQLGVWEFNPTYVLGLFWMDLPLEEWLFFLIVPFASVFIYEVLIYFFPKDHFRPFGKPFVWILVPFLLVMSNITLRQVVHFGQLFCRCSCTSHPLPDLQRKVLGALYFRLPRSLDPVDDLQWNPDRRTN